MRRKNFADGPTRKMGEAGLARQFARALAAKEHARLDTCRLKRSEKKQISFFPSTRVRFCKYVERHGKGAEKAGLPNKGRKFARLPHPFRTFKLQTWSAAKNNIE